MRVPKRFSNSAQTDAGHAALKTMRTAFSRSLARSGCFIRMGIMAPSPLKVVTPYFRISSQKRLAEKRRESTIGKTTTSDRSAVKNNAFA